MRKKVLIIVNPCSGNGKSTKWIGYVVNEFAKNEYASTVAVTEFMGDAKIIAEDATGYDLVVALGGDGTLNEVVNGLLQSKIEVPIGYIPMGCTNDFARSLGLSKNVKKSVKQIINGTNYNLDVCKINNKYFVYIASFGLFSRTSSTKCQKLKNKLGYWAYVLLGSKEIWNAPKIKLKLIAGGEEIEDEFIMGAFCNTKSIGGVVKLKDEFVQMNDGKFEILLVKYPKKLKDITDALDDIKHSRWNKGNVILKSVEQAEVTSISDDVWSLDGEFYSEKEKIDVNIVKNAIMLKK